MPGQWFELYRTIVMPAHCDAYGHLNVRHYAAFFDDAGWQMLGHMIWPLPKGVDFDDAEQMKTLMMQMALPAIAWVGLGFGVGAFAGASAANAVAQGRAVAGWIVAALLLAVAVWSVFVVPHPPWFAPLTVVVCAAAGWAAQRWRGRKA